MTIRRFWPACILAGLAVVVSSGPAAAQGAGAAGHWVGSIQTPGQPLEIEVDLKPGTPPAWIGVITIAAQNLKGFPLEAVSVQGTTVSFVIPRAPGTPTFKGTVSADGATLAGDFTQGEAGFPFTLTRAGDAVFPPPPAKSSAITKDLEGSWSGTLMAGGQSLRLMLKLAGGADGATGSIVSVDQGNTEIPIATITQTGMHLELSVPQIAGSYSGDLKDGKLMGTWSQGPGTFPLEFTRSTP